MENAYFGELSYFAPKPRTQLIAFAASPKKTTPKKVALHQAVWSYIKCYLVVCPLHGFNYLIEPKRYYFERVIWLILVIATTCSCLYVYADLADLYRSARVQTIVEDSVAPIFSKPFPSVGICPHNHINWPKLLEADQRFLPNASTETVKTFRQFFATVSDIHFGTPNNLKPLTELGMNLSLLDTIDVTKVMLHVGFTCNELFEYPCYWQLKAYNCCDIFSMQRTEYGYCFVFNSLVTKKDKEKQRNNRYYPFHNAKTSDKTGLDIIVNIDQSKQHPEYVGLSGINIMIKQPQQWHNDAQFVPPGTYIKIPVTPQFTITDERTRFVTPNERRCLFKNEIDNRLYRKPPGLDYRRNNCLTRCRQEYVFKYCNCSVDLFFPHDPSDNMPLCKAKDFVCFEENEDLFNNEHHASETDFVEITTNRSMECYCMNSCNQEVYVVNYNMIPLKDVDTSSNVKKIYVDVFYPSRYMITYGTRVRYTSSELLANFGGLIGLFLGASLMSGVEFVYYFTVGLYINLAERGYVSDRWLTSRESTAKVANLSNNKMVKQRKIFKQNKKRSPSSIYHLRH